MAKQLLHLPGVAGADEAGRGPLAGPVAAAAVVLPIDFDITGINDSKKLDPAMRRTLSERIKATAQYAIELSETEEIDTLNILWASLAAMSRAVGRLEPMPQRVLIDGNRIPPGLTVPSEAVVKGDGIYACIAAASILAKVERDQIMTEAAKIYPQYGFDRNFGYPTPDHLEALKRHGPCPIHRRSFRPVMECDQGCLIFEH